MQRLTLGMLLVVAGGLGACSRVQELPHQRTVAAVAHVPAVLDVPALVGLSYDGLITRLGPAQPVPAACANPFQVPILINGQLLDSTALFRLNGLRLVVTYDHRTRNVSDLLLLGTDEDSLMQQAHLQGATSSYVVLPVFQKRRSTELFGLRVVPLAAPKGASGPVPGN